MRLKKVTSALIDAGIGRVVADRTLQPDDIAGVSDLYPDGDFRASTGVIAGRVLMNGVAVKGAHVVAFNPRTGTLVGNFSSADGAFCVVAYDIDISYCLAAVACGDRFAVTRRSVPGPAEG